MAHRLDVTATVSPSSIVYTNDDPARWGAALLYGQAWDYTDTAALQAAGKFFCLPLPDTLHRGDHLTELITTDPIFAKCVRICHRYNDDDAGASGGDVPRHTSNTNFSVGSAWVRTRFKYYPGFTTSGTYPVAAASWKQIFVGYGDGAGNRFEFELLGATWFCAYVPTGGNTGTMGGPTVLSEPTALGEVQDLNIATTFNALNNAQWFETIQHYERFNADASARWRWWFRQLSVNDVRVDNNWYFTGRERTCTGTMPPIINLQCGINRNKTSPADALSSTDYSGSGVGGPFRGLHSYWAQLEVVDGTQVADPYGLAGWGV
jgi:hypothetical protein